MWSLSAPARPKRRSYRAAHATVERTRGRHPPGKDQGDNKPSTNRQLGHTDSNSQTKRVKSFGRLGPSGSLGRPNRSFPLSRQAQSVSKSTACRIASPAGSLFQTAPRQVWLPKPCLLGRRAAPIRDAGEGSGHKGSRNQRRGASDDSPCAKAIPIRPPGACRSVMVAKAFPPPPLAAPIRDAAEGTGHKGGRNQRRGAADDSLRERQSQFALLDDCRTGHGRQSLPSFGALAAPIRDAGEGNRAQKEPESATRARRAIRSDERQSQFAKPWRRSQVMAPQYGVQFRTDGSELSSAPNPTAGQSAGAPQSIIAALRMQTIVACAGFSLRLRIR